LILKRDIDGTEKKAGLGGRTGISDDYTAAVAVGMRGWR
jgi:hypothetical protein